MRRCIKHSRQCLTTFPNTSKLVKNTPLRVVFSTLLSVFENVVTHGLSCLIYYVCQKLVLVLRFYLNRVLYRSAHVFFCAILLILIMCAILCNYSSLAFPTTLFSSCGKSKARGGALKNHPKEWMRRK